MRIIVLIIAIALVAVHGADAQESRATGSEGEARRVQAIRIPNGRVQVDGVLAESEWALAEPAADFVQQQPDEGAPTTERSEIRFMYDDENLYVGGMLFDARPDRLVVNELKRDFNARDGDLFVLVLDTFDDDRTGYGFQTNPGGAQRETQSYNDGRNNNQNWDAVWYLDANITDEGWALEYAIPFKSLRFPDVDVQNWGVQVFRLIRHKNEVTVWSPVPREFSQFAVSYAGVLEGIEGVKPGRNLRIKPFVTSNASSVGGTTGSDADAGLDLKVGIGTNLIFDATYRTDFSQVEADEQQVNLTRFNLFFPEKREFFLENQGTFQMGPPLPRGGRSSLQSSGPPDLIPFFSRTIGLTEDGAPLPLLGGLRLSGKVGSNNVGAMNIQTEEDPDLGLPATNYSVVRFAREFLEFSQVSAFYLGKERGDFSNRVGGADFRLNFFRTLNIDGLWMQSSTTDVGDDSAGRVGFDWDAGLNKVTGSFTSMGTLFRDEMGFIPREGVDIANATYARRFRPAATYQYVREYRPEITYARFTNDGMLETETAQTSLFVDFADASQFRFTYRFNEEVLIAPFEIRSSYDIAPGRYAFRDGETDFFTDRARRLSVNGGFRFGDFWDGSRFGFTAGGRLRLSEKLATTLNYSRDNVDLPGASFTADLVTFRVDGSFSTRMFLNAFVQYSSQREEVTSNVRFDFIHHPLSDIFLVYNETRPTKGGGPTDRAIILKFTHLFSF